MIQGYIKTWRKIIETSFYKDSYAVHLALHLIIRANHADRKIIFNNEEITIKEGQHICGRHSLAQETGIKPSTVRNKLALLKNTGFLDIKSNNRFSIITLLKYNQHQKGKLATGQLLGQPEDSQRTAKGQPKDTLKKYKNDKKVKTSGPTIGPPLVDKSKPNRQLQAVIDHVRGSLDRNHITYTFTGKHARILRKLTDRFTAAGVRALWDLFIVGDREHPSIEIFAVSAAQELTDKPWKAMARKYEEQDGMQPAGRCLRQVGL